MAAIARNAALGDIRLAIAFEHLERCGRTIGMFEVDFHNARLAGKRPAVARSSALVSGSVLHGRRANGRSKDERVWFGWVEPAAGVGAALRRNAAHVFDASDFAAQPTAGAASLAHDIAYIHRVELVGIGAVGRTLNGLKDNVLRVG